MVRDDITCIVIFFNHGAAGKPAGAASKSSSPYYWLDLIAISSCLFDSFLHSQK